MFIETDGKERTYKEFQNLVYAAGLKIINKILLTSRNTMLILEKL